MKSVRRNVPPSVPLFFMASSIKYRTIDNHLAAHTPQPDYDMDQEWEWPSWKFGYDDPSVLFTTLHAEYNSINCAIQDPYGWHHDVCDISNVAKDRNEFLTLLRKRQQERFDEIQSAWEKTKALLVGQPSRWEATPDKDSLWGAFIRVSRNFSYDSFVAYFGSYIANDQPPNPGRSSTPVTAHPPKQHQPKKKARANPAARPGVTKRSEGRSSSRPNRAIEQSVVRRSLRLKARDNHLRS